MLAQGLARRMFKVSKTHRQQSNPNKTPSTVKAQLNKRVKRLRLWQAMQPLPTTYPEPEVLPWKVLG